MLDSHLYKRRDSSLGMYQLERTIEFELQSWIINSNASSGHTFGVNVGYSEDTSSYTF